jgi:hypothetical protein
MFTIEQAPEDFSTALFAERREISESSQPLRRGRAPG